MRDQSCVQVLHDQQPHYPYPCCAAQLVAGTMPSVSTAVMVAPACPFTQEGLRLQKQLLGLTHKSTLVLQHTRKAMVLNSEGANAVNTYSPDAHEAALMAQAKGLAVLSECLAPMVFTLLCGFTSLARQMADGRAPAGSDVGILMYRMCEALGTLLQCQQEDGEACSIKVAGHAEGAEKHASDKAEQPMRLKEQQRAEMCEAASSKNAEAVCLGAAAGSACTGVFAGAAIGLTGVTAGPIGCVALAAGVGGSLGSYLAGCGYERKANAHLNRARELAAEEKAAREAAPKVECAWLALQQLQFKLNRDEDASNSTVTGVLATALLSIVGSMQVMLNHFGDMLQTPGGIPDRSVLLQLDTLHTAALNAEKQWGVEVQGSACGLLKACNVTMNDTLLGEWLESHKARLLKAAGFSVEQASRFITDINTLPSGAMAGEAVSCYMNNNSALLLDPLRQVVPQLFASGGGCSAAPAAGAAHEASVDEREPDREVSAASAATA